MKTPTESMAKSGAIEVHRPLPLMTGYVRLVRPGDRGRRGSFCAGLRAQATIYGFWLDRCFVEDFWSRPCTTAFEDLIEHIQHDHIAHVIVPCLTHFSVYPDFQASAVDLLGLLGVRLWAVES